jgi:Hom_end-associated Hint
MTILKNSIFILEMTDTILQLDGLSPPIQHKSKKSYYKVDISDIASSVFNMNKYMSIHPEFFKTNVNKKMIHIHENQIYNIYLEPVLFKDEIHNTRGFITTKYDEMTKKVIMVIEIKNKSSVKDVQCYIKQIDNYVLNRSKHGNTVELYYYKILSDSIIKHCYYDQPIPQWEKDVETLQREFFLPDKDYLLAIMKNKVNNDGIGNTSAAWNNLILHGKPGTGKCLGINTPVFLYNGDIVMSQNIKVNDILIGDDSMPRIVASLARGEEEMFMITHSSNGDSYTVNRSHILSLIYNGQSIDIPVTNFISMSKENQAMFYGYKAMIDVKANYDKHKTEPSININYDKKKGKDKGKDTINNNEKDNYSGYASNNSVFTTFYIVLDSISIKSIGIGKYYGFSLTGGTNNRFLLGNHIVTHNSSFIYRVSMMLKLSILSVDLSLYLNKKRELYALLYGQEFRLPSSDNKEPALDNCIIVFEEFDASIEKLIDIENIFKYKDILKRNYLILKNKELEEKVSSINVTVNKKSSDSIHTNGNYDVRRNGNTEESHYTDVCLDSDGIINQMNKLMMEASGVDAINNRVTNKAREEIFEKRMHDNEIVGINSELNNLIQGMDEDNKSNLLRPKELLELIQGPVNRPNRPIIANTNEFEKIQNFIPALFRNGRMTPVPFVYLDWPSLNELTQYYFDSNMSLEPFEINIPQSKIIEIAIKYKLTGKDFSMFEHELKQACVSEHVLNR